FSHLVQPRHRSHAPRRERTRIFRTIGRQRPLPAIVHDVDGSVHARNEYHVRRTEGYSLRAGSEAGETVAPSVERSFGARGVHGKAPSRRGLVRIAVGRPTRIRLAHLASQAAGGRRWAENAPG